VSLLTVVVANQRGLASGLQFVNADNVGAPEHSQGTGTVAWTKRRHRAPY
jgi:hypothetical protein